MKTRVHTGKVPFATGNEPGGRGEGKGVLQVSTLQVARHIINCIILNGQDTVAVRTYENVRIVSTTDCKDKV